MGYPGLDLGLNRCGEEQYDDAQNLVADAHDGRF